MQLMKKLRTGKRKKKKNFDVIANNFGKKQGSSPEFDMYSRNDTAACSKKMDPCWLDQNSDS